MCTRPCGSDPLPWRAWHKAHCRTCDCILLFAVCVRFFFLLARQFPPNAINSAYFIAVTPTRFHKIYRMTQLRAVSRRVSAIRRMAAPVGRMSFRPRGCHARQNGSCRLTADTERTAPKAANRNNGERLWFCLILTLHNVRAQLGGHLERYGQTALQHILFDLKK